MASLFDREKLFSLQLMVEEEKEEEEDVVEIKPKRENSNTCSEELVELGRICSETPEELLGEVLHLRADDILFESRVFHCIPQGKILVKKQKI